MKTILSTRFNLYCKPRNRIYAWDSHSSFKDMIDVAHALLISADERAHVTVTPIKIVGLQPVHALPGISGELLRGKAHT